MTMQTTLVRQAAAQDAVLLHINNTPGPTPGTVKLFTGAMPADLSLGATGTLLSTMTLVDGSVDAFGATNTTTMVATGYTAGGIFASDPSAAAGGVIGYWRMQDYTGADMMQGTATALGGGGDIQFNTLTVVVGNVVMLTSMTSQISGLF